MSTSSFHDEIVRQLEESAKIKNAIAFDMTGQIEQMIVLLVEIYRKGGKVVLCGNGGSAADAQHLAGELIGRLREDRPALPAIALTANSSILTAEANDRGYETVFSRQVEALVDEKDLVIGITTSGSSPNVVKALEKAAAKGAKTIGLTGAGGGKLAGKVDLLVAVPSGDTQRIQEAHITVGHIVCDAVEREISGKG